MGLYLDQQMLTKSPYAIVMYKGQTKNIALSLTQDALNEKGATVIDDNGDVVDAPLDLTGAVIFFTVKVNPGDPKVILNKSSADASQIQILLPTTDGKIKIFLYPVDTIYLDPGVYIFDVWVQLVSGARYPVVENSEFIIKETVTSFV